MSLTDYVLMPGEHYQDACDAIREKTGGTDLIRSGELGASIRSIKTGVELPELTNPASEAEVFDGYEVIDENGAKRTGTFTLDEELSAQDSLISQIQTALEGKSAGGGSGGSVDTVTVTFANNTDMYYYSVSYVDTNGEFTDIGVDSFNSVTLQMPKGIIMINSPDGQIGLVSNDGNAQIVGNTMMYGQNAYYVITSNTQFTASGRG